MFKLSNTKILSFILLSSLFFSYTWIYSFYISTRNVDFEKYYDYINYFTGVNVDIDFGQGVIYYFLIAKRLISKLDLVNLSNTELLVGAAVQEINFIFFLFGLFGLFLFLKSKNYETETILATLILLIYFPQTIYLRAVMKPEIIAFAFVPWILFFIEKYLLDQDVKKLFYAIPFFALVINSKASVAGMLCIYLIFAYFEILKKINLKNFVILSISIIFIISFLQFESYSITGNRIIDRPYDSEYDYKANPKILLNINLYEIVKHPFFSLNKNGETYHSKSVINILLLDTFGDYFNQIFDDEVNYFAKHRKNIFTNNSEDTFSETRQINYKGIFNQYLINNLNHIRKLISLMFSVIFYFSILIFSYRDKPNRKYYLAPLAGISLLYINSLGIPSNNFNPIKADTFKAFYFSSFLVISLLFIGVKIFKKINFLKIIILFIYILSIFFIAGHPRENNQNLSEHLINANQYLPFCTINNILIYENELLKSLFPSGNINGVKSDCSQKNQISQNYEQRYKHDQRHSEKCVNKKREILNNPYELTTSNLTECRIYALEQVKNQNNLIIPKTPYLSLSLLLICLYFIFLEAKLFKEIKDKHD